MKYGPWTPLNFDDLLENTVFVCTDCLMRDGHAPHRFGSTCMPRSCAECGRKADPKKFRRVCYAKLAASNIPTNMTSATHKISRRSKVSLRWLRWTVKRDGLTQRSNVHAFRVVDGKLDRKSLCGRTWKERGVEVVATPELGRCPRCDAELREGPIEDVEANLLAAEERAKVPPTEYRPRFTMRDFE